MQVVITECSFYLDLGKYWFWVKPISPRSKAFFVSKTFNTTLPDIPNEISNKIRVYLNISTEQTLGIHEVSADKFLKYCDPEDHYIETIEIYKNKKNTTMATGTNYRHEAALEAYPNIKKLGLTVCDYNCTWYVSAEQLENILKNTQESSKLMSNKEAIYFWILVSILTVILTWL